MIKKYQTPVAFRRALEDRIKVKSRERGTDIQRMRRSVAFDRLLCRLFASTDNRWILKGGYAMELRIQAARATKDIDLSLPAGVLQGDEKDQNRILHEMLQNAAGKNLDDFFTFVIGEPMCDLDAAPHGGARFPVTSTIAGKAYVSFHLDLGIGDVFDEPFEVFTGTDWLGFAGIPAGKYQGLSKEGQFSEKLHAYTFPRSERKNSRVKDLVDMLILINLGLEPARLQNAVNKTFLRRKTHLLPEALESPPDFWKQPYTHLAKECGLSESIENGFSQISTFYDQYLSSIG